MLRDPAQSESDQANHRETLRRSFAWGALLAFLTLAAYLPALGGGWVWDDDSYVTHNPLLSHDVPVQEALRRIWTPGETPQYYPLVFTSFLIESRLYGADFAARPLGFHLANVALHGLSAILLWTILRRLDVAGAWFAAAIFALHPMNVESVAWVTERKNVLALAFGLASVLAWLKATAPRTEDDASPRYGMAALALGLFIGGMLSKTTIAAVAPAIVLIHLWRRDRLATWQWAMLAAFFAVGIPLGLHTAHVERTLVGAEGDEFALTFAQRLALAPRSVLFYAWTFVWPSRLAFIYPRWTLDVSSAVTWVPLLALAAAFAAGAVAWTRGSRGPLTLLLLLLAALFPALGFFDVYPFRYSYVADHFAYLATVPLAVAVSVLLTTLARRMSAVLLRVGAAALLAILALSTAANCLAYADEESLWRSSLAANEDAWMPWTNLAGTLLPQSGRLLDAGQTEEGIETAREAETYARRSIDIDDTKATAWTNLSEALRLQGRHAEAFDAITRAETLAPHVAHIHWRKGRLLELTGDHEGAAAAYRTSLELPDKTRAPVQIGPVRRERRLDLARVLTKADRLADAVPVYEAMLADDPADAHAAANLARVTQRLGNLELSRAAHRVALEHAPDMPFVIAVVPGFVEVLLASPTNEELVGEAVDAATAFRGLMHDHPLALVLLARAEAARGRADEARALLTLARERAADEPQQVRDEIDRRERELLGAPDP